MAFYVEGDGIKIMMQVMLGDGFRVWFTRYWTTKKVVLKARSGIPILELRISWRNKIKGTWEKIVVPEVPEFFYQLGFVPHTVTRAEFEANEEYQTFDVHFDPEYFNAVGMDYKLFQQFINMALKGEPAELYSSPKRCSGLMLDAAYAILRNAYSAYGKRKSLDNNVENILLAVLEDIDPDGLIISEVTSVQFTAVHYARELIHQHFPKYPGNRALAQMVNINLTYFITAFKRVFGVPPREFYNLLRVDKGRSLLKQGFSITTISLELEYESEQSFSKAFKKEMNISPKEYQLRFRP